MPPWLIGWRERVVAQLKVPRKQAVDNMFHTEHSFLCARCGGGHNRFRNRIRTLPAAYCEACHAEWMRLNRPKHRDLQREAREKANCRAYANVYQRRGKLAQMPCEKCGGADSEKHHDDYSKPLDVRWLCRECHLAEHYMEEYGRAA